MPDAPETRIHSAAPSFLVSDVDQTVRWYVEELGFTLAGSFPPKPPTGWASLMRDGAELMLQRLPGYQKPDLYDQRGAAGVWDVYFRTNGVRRLYASLKDKPFIKQPLKRQPYKDWEFEVQDPNGYILVFGGDAEREG